jgi:magnesium transporter
MKKHHDKAFTSPGSLIYLGKDRKSKAKLTAIRYNEGGVESPFSGTRTKEFVHWYNLDGVHDVNKVEKVGREFNFHPLLIEDVLNTYSKPKLEYFGEDCLFLIMKVLKMQDAEVETEHVAMVLGADTVVTFQEAEGTDAFQPIRGRLEASVGKTRKGKSDYLFYSLCDVIVDSYYLLMDEFSEHLEAAELSVIERPSDVDQKRLYKLRRELLVIRKAIAPLREVFNTLMRDETKLIHPQTLVYFRDVYDHVLQLLEMIDSYREMLENIQNNLMNILSTKMNGVMKTLTVFTAIFMPLSFIAGIYGMNFHRMPELENPNGYYFTLGGMGLLGIVLWVYFKWKKYV